MRTEILLNEKWLFYRGDIREPKPVLKMPVYGQSKTERKLAGPASYNYVDIPNPMRLADKETRSTGWQYVDIPHDYVVLQDLCEQENNALGYLHYDNAWYRKHFTLPEGSEGKRIVLRFDGIAGKSTVYLNGCLMHHNFSAYNTFEVDISSYAYFDKENILAVYVNTEEWEGWWYQGGGIYRNVHLSVTELCAIDLWGVYAPYTKVDEHTWQIDFETTLVNDSYESAQLSVTSCVLDGEGNCVAQASGNGDPHAGERRTDLFLHRERSAALGLRASESLYCQDAVVPKRGTDRREHHSHRFPHSGNICQKRSFGQWQENLYQRCVRTSGCGTGGLGCAGESCPL